MSGPEPANKSMRIYVLYGFYTYCIVNTYYCVIRIPVASVLDVWPGARRATGTGVQRGLSGGRASPWLGGLSERPVPLRVPPRGHIGAACTTGK